MQKITAVDLLRLIHPNPSNWICLGGIPRKDSAGKGFPTWFWTERKDVIRNLGKLKQTNTRGQKNIYYSMANFQHGVCGKHAREKKNVEGIQVVWLDFDDVTEASESFWKGESWENIPAPNIGVATSPGHAQFFWLLKEALSGEEIQDEGGLEHLLKGLTRKTGADIAAVDVSRVMRLPGYRNLNRQAFMVEAFLIHEERIYKDTYEKLKVMCPCAEEKKKGSSAPKEPAEPQAPPRVATKCSIGHVARRNAMARWNATRARGKSASEADWAVLGYLFSIGNVSENDMGDFLREIHPGKHGKYYLHTIEKFKKIAQ
jgi:hypothetical protein